MLICKEKRTKYYIAKFQKGEEENFMEKEIIFVVEESPEGGYEAYALGHAIFTEANTLEELKEMIRDAVRCHFDESEKPAIIRLHLVRDEVFAA